MRTLIVLLIILLAILQYKLWFQTGGVPNIFQLRRELLVQQEENKQLKLRNDILSAEVRDLKHGKSAVEGRARHELGMIKEGETFYQVLESK